MKTLRLTFLALFVALTSNLMAQDAAGALDDLLLAIREDPENTAVMVEAVVAEYPDQAAPLVNRLLATFPDLAEEIVFGAVNGLPAPQAEEAVFGLVTQAVRYRPALAGAIVSGALRAVPDMEGTIIAAARAGLREGPGVIGRTGSPNGPENLYDETLRLTVSPSS
jgi:hypothetical protein